MACLLPVRLSCMGKKGLVYLFLAGGQYCESSSWYWGQALEDTGSICCSCASFNAGLRLNHEGGILFSVWPSHQWYRDYILQMNLERTNILETLVGTSSDIPVADFTIEIGVLKQVVHVGDMDDIPVFNACPIITHNILKQPAQIGEFGHITIFE